MPKKKFFILVFSVFSILSVLSICYVNSIFSPVKADTETKQIDFEIEPGTSSLEIAEGLKGAGLIKSKWAFLVYLKCKKGTILAGIYELSPSNNLVQITQKLINGEVKEWIVTFPEGFSLKDMGERLEKQGIVTKEQFLKEASQVSKYQESHHFLKGVSASDLEGYLFPDTYRFLEKSSAEEMIKRILDNFKGKTEEKSVDHTTVILASIIEREAKNPEDRAKIASVYLNRLAQDMKLEADPTIQYAKGNWNPITTADYKIESPYNTYKYPGLPPGPICNPGLESIQAILNPAKTDYLYFFHTEEGQAIFTTSQEEHEQKKQEYLK